MTRIFQRVFGAQASLVGQTLGSLSIQGVISVKPLRYWGKCRICNSTASYSHPELVQGRQCRQPQCGLERERLEMDRQDAARRRAAREAMRTW